MQRWIAALDKLRRRLFGRYELDDPRPIRRSAPYTFFTPSPERVAAIAPGDQAQLMFRSVPPSPEWGAERMWVEVSEVGPDGLVGTLVNRPNDIPQLEVGATVRFQPYHVISLVWAHPDQPHPPRGPGREYWERCWVDDCVLEEGAPVGFLFREEPDTPEGEEYADSGWRIRGDLRGASDEELEARTASYVALGAVLNRDDSWLHLIDEPIGSAFIKDFETGRFEPEAD